jgi:hypothetical protein
MDDYAARLVSTDLAENEQLLWAGRPEPLTLAIVKSWPAAFGAAVFLGMGSIGLSFQGAAAGPVSFAILSGLAILAPALLIVGVALALIPALRFYQAQGTIYALTDERAIVLVHFPYRTVSSIMANRIAFVRRRERSDGASDVLFAEHVNRAGEAGVLIRREGFHGIPDGPQVDRLIRRTFFSSGSQQRSAPGVPHGPWTSARTDR